MIGRFHVLYYIQACSSRRGKALEKGQRSAVDTYCYCDVPLYHFLALFKCVSHQTHCCYLDIYMHFVQVPQG